MQTTQVHPGMPGKAGNGTPWYKHRWPWLLMLGPLVVVVAGTYTAWLAVKGQDALVVDDYYKQGRAINQDLSRDRVATSMKLAAELQYDAAAGRLTGNLSSLGQPLSTPLVIRLIHSTMPEKDVVLHAQSDQSGNFSTLLPMLDMARWQVQIESEKRDWRLGGEWIWPHDKKVSLKAMAS